MARRRRVTRARKSVHRKSKARAWHKKTVRVGRRTKVRVIRRGKKRAFRLIKVNPVAALKGWTTGLTALPKNVPALLKGKDMVKKIGFAAGGAGVGLIGGSMLQKLTMPMLQMIPGVGGQLNKGLVQRALGAAHAYTAGFLAGKVALKNKESQTAFITGAGAAALIEAIFPGRVSGLLSKLPVVGGYVAMSGLGSPVMGLAGMYGSDQLAAYVDAPAYQGVGAYVDAPAYQGIGHDAGMGAYVDAPAYQGVGSDEALAGMGSNMSSHLDG